MILCFPTIDVLHMGDGLHDDAHIFEFRAPLSATTLLHMSVSLSVSTPKQLFPGA